MICPSCGAQGDSARFKRRHPALCSAKKREVEEKKAFSRQLGQDTRCVEGLLDILDPDDHNRLEHFASLSEVLPYVWVDGDSNTIDIRQMTYKHACAVRDWMLSHSYGDTPYDDTPQFKNTIARIERGDAAWSTAQNALRKKE